MEGLLILIGLWVLDIVIKKVAANKKAEQQRKLDEQRQQTMQQYEPDDSGSEGYDEDDEQDYEEPEARPSRSLQDLIRQFENAQREAEQGNIEPPTPPDPLAKRPQRDPNEPLTLRDIAEVVIDMDVVDAEFLMDEFGLSEGTAITVLNDLQKHRIVGRDMGTGECDVLVHDLDELDNLFNRETRTESAPEPAETPEVQEARQQELERQRELNALEERAKSTRESAAAFSSAQPVTESVEGETPAKHRPPLVSTCNINDVRKGFIWAKVIDEPRFKRRWSAQYR